MVAGGDNCTVVEPLGHTVYTVVPHKYNIIRHPQTHTHTHTPTETHKHTHQQTPTNTHTHTHTPIETDKHTHSVVVHTPTEFSHTLGYFRTDTQRHKQQFIHTVYTPISTDSHFITHIFFFKIFSSPLKFAEYFSDHVLNFFPTPISYFPIPINYTPHSFKINFKILLK